MGPQFVSGRVPTEVSDRLRMAAAVAAEQVLDVHVMSALEVIEEGADRAPVDRLLTAYARLHYLGAGQTWRLRERVLAALGREMGSSATHRRLAGPRSLFGQLVVRLRGRVHHELRDWVDLHTARVQLALIDVHVRHALAFVRILEGHAATGEALQAYTRSLGLRSASAELVRLKALLTIDRADATTPVETLHPSPPHLPLRVADGGS
jgi:hypothetical protein